VPDHSRNRPMLTTAKIYLTIFLANFRRDEKGEAVR